MCKRPLFVTLSVPRMLVAALCLFTLVDPAEAQVRIAYAWGNNPTAASYTPSALYVERDDASVQVSRLDTGRYRVVLGSLIAGRGNVQASSYGQGGVNCQVASWGASGADLTCYDSDGRLTDSRFTVLAVATQNAQDIAYVWANDPVAAEYAPSSRYAWSPGGAARVTRMSAGRYRVALAPRVVGPEATVQVTAYGGAARHCGVLAWGRGSVSVQCWDAAGHAADAQFSLLAVRKGAAGDRFAFAWADQANRSDYTPSPVYAYAPGTSPRVQRSRIGLYQVTLNGVMGNIQTTAYGGPSGVSCNPVGWGAARAVVACVDPRGRPVDSRFTLLATTRDAGVAGARPDLLVSFQGVLRVLRPGEPLGAGARAVARNAGSEPAPGSRTDQAGYMIDVVLSTDAKVPEGFAAFHESFREDVLLRGGRASNTPDLAGGASAALDIENDTIPADTPDGEYRLCARIDPANIVAESREDNNVACQYVRVVRAPRGGVSFTSVQSRSPIELTLDERFYEAGDPLHATLDLGAAFVRGDVEGVLLVSEEAGDMEHLVLRRSGGTIFRDTNEAFVRLARGASGIQLDGTLTARPGDRIVALFYPDAARHAEREATLVVDLAIFESASGRRDAVGAPLTAQVRVEPQLAAIDRDLAASGERPFGSFLTRGSLPVQVATEQVVFRPRSAADLSAFLAFSGGRTVSHQPANTESTGDLPENRMYLIAFDPARARPDRLGDLRRLFGETHDMLIGSDAVSRLSAFVLESRLRGFAVAANQKAQFMGGPVTTETGTGALSATMEKINASIDVPAAWAFNALWDSDEQRIDVGVVDMGFITDHPDFRRPASGEMRECDFDDGFAADVLLRGGNCGPGRARGVPTVGNSLFGERTWHGTGAVITAGGVLNNGWRPGQETGHVGGAAGVAGQVMVPMLYKTGLSSYVYEMGSAMRQAVDQRASCINISAGYPCRIQSSVLPDIDLCLPGGREGLCAVLFGVASTVAATVCASAGAAAAIPIVGPLIAAPLLVACGAATTTATVVLPSCLSFFITSGDVRSAMRLGAEYAERHGVPVVASAGNVLRSVPPELLPFIDISNIDAGAWGIIPATLPTVIGVGAVSPSDRRNRHFNGSAVTIWAPEGTAYHAPSDVDSVPTGVGAFEWKRFGATSSAAPFVTGVIANMQAINPALDPRTPGLSDAEKRAIPGQIRSILTATAAPSPDAVVRGIVSPNLAVAEAARRAGVPLLAGYNTALNFDETTASAAKDTSSTAQAISFGSTVTGTILTIRGEAPTGDYRDEDWYRVPVPSTPNRGTFTVRARLRMPTASRWGRLELGGGFAEEATREVNPDETEITFVRTRLVPGGSFSFPVRGVGTQDNVYRLTMDPPTHVPPRPDPFEPMPTTPRLDGWVLRRETLAAKTWELFNDEPSLHTVADTDRYVIAGIPPTQVFGRLAASGACQPRLEISHPNGINIAYSDDRGAGPFTLDPHRRERPSLPPAAGERGHPVSVMTYASESSLPTEITLTYSVAPGGVPIAYAVRLTWITVEADIGGLCSRP